MIHRELLKLQTNTITAIEYKIEQFAQWQDFVFCLPFIGLVFDQLVFDQGS